MDMFLWVICIASVFLIRNLALYKILVGPIITAAVEHLNNTKNVFLGIGGIELTSGLSLWLE